MSGERVVRVGLAARGEWDAFVASRPEADVLQAWAWGEAMAEVGQPPVRIAIRGEDGRIRGIAQALVRPTSMDRTVLYVPHGPVWEREAPDASALLRALLVGIRRAGRAERGIVVKLDPRAGAATPAPAGQGTRPPGRPGGGGRSGSSQAGLDPVTRQLTAQRLRPARHDLQARTTRIVELLDGGPALMKTWDSKARNLARRSEREGVEVRITRRPDPEALAAFHALLEATAERGTFRTHPPGFFATLSRELGVDGWYLGVAWLADRPIAGMVAARVGDRAYYLYGATDRDPAYRNANAGYGTMAAVMAALANDGVGTLDLWGVADEDDPDADPEWRGFSAFKARFGGLRVRHPGTWDLVVDRFWYLVRDWRERWRERR